MQSQMMQTAMKDIINVQQSVEGKFATMQVNDCNKINWIYIFFQRVITEIDQMQREQWNEALNNDVLLTRIENLERKLAAKVLKINYIK